MERLLESIVQRLDKIERMLAEALQKPSPPQPRSRDRFLDACWKIFDEAEIPRPPAAVLRKWLRDIAGGDEKLVIKLLDAYQVRGHLAKGYAYIVGGIKALADKRDRKIVLMQVTDALENPFVSEEDKERLSKLDLDSLSTHHLKELANRYRPQREAWMRQAQGKS